MAYFFDKSKRALEFFQHRGSKLKFINLERNYYFFFDFQPVTLTMLQNLYNTVYVDYSGKGFKDGKIFLHLYLTLILNINRFCQEGPGWIVHQLTLGSSRQHNRPSFRNGIFQVFIDFKSS